MIEVEGAGGAKEEWLSQHDKVGGVRRNKTIKNFICSNKDFVMEADLIANR